jgi:predicted RNA-binding Zn-ribbon protein involved in translation (DUF1610 family)
MRRGKSQVLFRYLPESIVDYSDTQTIAKVVKWNTREFKEVSYTKVISRIERKIQLYQKKRFFPAAGSYKDYVFLEPISIDVDLFPLTFNCKKCGRIFRFNDINLFRKLTKNYKCAKCEGDLEQIDLIHFHECGLVDSLQIKKCNNEKHGYEYITLDRNNSDSPKNWQWRCKICGKFLGDVKGYCSECNKPMSTVPFRKSQVFYPQSVTLVNVPGKNEGKINSSPDLYKLVLASYLDILEDFKLEKLLDATEDDENIKEFESKIQKLRDSGLPENFLQQVIKEFKVPDNCNGKKKIIEKVDHLFSNSEEDIKDIAMNIYEYTETLNLGKITSIEDVIKESQNNEIAGIDKSMFSKRMKDIGIEKAFVINDFPVMSAVFGYTRGSVNSDECTLRSFGEDTKFPGKVPIYVNATETEAIVLQFDRYKILKWLQMNNLVTEIPEKNDILSQKIWFLNNLCPSHIPIYDETKEDEIITKSVYKLIHTISHSLLRKASGIVGLDKDSLAEMLLPNVPAIIIYSNNSHDFQLGGLHTLFENGILNWIDTTENGVEKCLYDPVCIDGESSCHACLHLSEVSCVHFNRDLGRDVLIGKKNDTSNISGFWEGHIKESLVE